jgi:pimeloyl-ACP methyl ester carboxylesterase
MVVAAVCAAAVLAPRAAAADHALLHAEPQGPAAAHFPADFPELVDHEWGFRIGGFGGIERGLPIERPPVIFVHGNTADHGDWYPVRDDFVAAGWSEQELWALSYNGLGANVSSTEARPNPKAEDERAEMGHDGVSRATSNEVNVPDLVDFIEAVRDYTGSERFSLVSHSLGVTIARRSMQLRPDLAADLVAFVGIAGANHGTSLCPPGSEGVVVGCDEIAMGTDWLAELNGPDGERETYGDTTWMTIRDGSGLTDRAFLTPVYADSPVLKGATNLDYPLADHNELRLREDIVATYRTFIEEAIAARQGDVADEPTPADPTDPRSPDLEDVTGEGGHDAADGADRSGPGDPDAGGPAAEASGPILPATGPSPAGGLLPALGAVLLTAGAAVQVSTGPWTARTLSP